MTSRVEVGSRERSGRSKWGVRALDERAVLADGHQVDRALACEGLGRAAEPKEAANLLLLCELLEAVGVQEGPRRAHEGGHVIPEAAGGMRRWRGMLRVRGGRGAAWVHAMKAEAIISRCESELGTGPVTGRLP